MNQKSEQLIFKIKTYLESCYEVEDELPPKDMEITDWYPADNWPKHNLIVNTPEKAMPLYEENKGAAFECCKKYRRLVGHRLPIEDYKQIVLKCLWGAALMYDEEKSDAKFATFLWTVCNRRCREEINRFYLRPGRYMPDIDEVCEIIQLVNDKSKSESLFDKLEFRSVIESNLKVNAFRDAEILIENLLFDHTLEQCGMKHGVSKERARQLRERALNKVLESHGEAT